MTESHAHEILPPCCASDGTDRQQSGVRSPGPYIVPHQGQADADVLTAMRELEPVGLVSLHLIYWHNRSQAQVAEELRVPLPVVRAAVARGMRQLAACIEARAVGSAR